MLKSRESFTLIDAHINKKLYSREFQIASDFIKNYYGRDSKAEYVDLRLLDEVISSELLNEKHVQKFTDLLNEAYQFDTSEQNVKTVILNAKKRELSVELASAIANEKQHDHLVEQYNDLLKFTDLDSLAEDGAEVFCGDELDDLLNHERDGLMTVYPLALNEKLDGGVGPSDHIVIMARPEMGKCLAVGTKVLMADGTTKAVETVRNGELVAGVTGPRVVSGTTTGRALMYKITYPWGDSYTVNDEHVLSLKRSKTEGKHKNGDILNVTVKEYMTWPEGRKQRYKGWKAGQEYSHKDLPMDPYLLGIWLGDGSTGKSQITTTDKEILAAYVEKYGDPTTVEKGISHSFGYSGLYRDLAKAGVWENKHIPHLYLTASRSQRLELLAGLLDSDGHNEVGGGYSIVTKLDVLKDGYLKLARSLGFHATARRVFKRATNSNHSGDWYWNVWIGAEAYDETPVRLERKKGKQDANPKRKGLHFRITVEPVGEGEYAGFCLDGDHLFLLEDFTVTHNTGLVLTMACGFARQGHVGIIFNNEENIRKLRKRALYCCTGMTRQEVDADPERAKRLARENGYFNIIFVSLSPGTPGQIEAFVKKYKAKWFITDQIRNLVVKSENRTNQLEAAAQSQRDIAKRNAAAAFSITQAGDSASGKAVLEMGDVDGSNTGIPGACDVLIGIGGTEEQLAQGIRVLSLSKNKLGGDHANFPVKFNQWLSKYVSFKE